MPPTPSHRRLFTALVVALWLTAIIVKSVIRPELGAGAPTLLRLLLNSMPSLIGGLTVPLCFLAVHPRPQPTDIRRACQWGLLILLAAEGVELLFERSTYDWFDIVASLIGVATAALFARAFLASPKPVVAP